MATILEQGNKLYQNIVEHPEEDEPRLIYAEWLDQNGQSDRAKFVRLEIEIEQLIAKLREKYGEDDDCEDDPDQQRVDELLSESLSLRKAHDEWKDELKQIPGVIWDWGMGTERGFVTRVIFTEVEPFCNLMSEIFSAAPITRVKFAEKCCTDKTAKLVAASGHLSKLKSLHFTSGSITDDGVAALASSPHISNLQDLAIRMNQVKKAGAIALIASPYLKNIHSLWLDNNPIPSEIREQLRQRFGDGYLKL